MRTIRMRLAVPVVVAVLVFGSSTLTLATTGTGNQNPDLSVLVSLTSDNPVSLDVATVGDTVTLTLAVTNNKPWTSGARPERVRANLTLTVPGGESFTIGTTVWLFP